MLDTPATITADRSGGTTRFTSCDEVASCFVDDAIAPTETGNDQGTSIAIPMRPARAGCSVCQALPDLEIVIATSDAVNFSKRGSQCGNGNAPPALAQRRDFG
jgi:hypothetical protein